MGRDKGVDKGLMAKQTKDKYLHVKVTKDYHEKVEKVAGKNKMSKYVIQAVDEKMEREK